MVGCAECYITREKVQVWDGWAESLHLIRKPGECMMTGEQHYIPIERSTVYCVDIIIYCVVIML